MVTKRVMVFVDGTNFLRGIGRELGTNKLRADNPSDAALKVADSYINGTSPIFASISKHDYIRRYWFASYKGGDEVYMRLSEALRGLYFEPVLFKMRGEREKGVDIALTMSMLTNAFNQNYDIGILFAGDEDYVELVKEVKRYGQIIAGSYFKEGLSDSLKLAFDYFHHPQFDTKGKRYSDILVKELKDSKSS